MVVYCTVQPHLLVTRPISWCPSVSVSVGSGRDQYDALLDLWGYLCDRLFSRLDTTFTAAVDRLGVSLQRLWVVNNVVKGRMDVVDAFFTAHSKRLRPGDHDHNPDLDWTPWLSIRYIEVGIGCGGGRKAAGAPRYPRPMGVLVLVVYQWGWPYAP